MKSKLTQNFNEFKEDLTKEIQSTYQMTTLQGIQNNFSQHKAEIRSEI